ncbi:MAG: LysR family transcriptional regulator [Faecousia sp.]
MLDLHQIACFVSVYEAGSISRAAESTFISQQAVSHSLRELEKKLGGPLFERSPNGVTPTALGKALYDDARKLLLSCNAFEKRARLLTRGRPGIFLAFANGVFSVEDAPDLNQLTAFAQKELGTNLNLSEQTASECLRMLGSGEADFSCIFNPEPKSGLCVRELKEYPLYAGMAPGHPLASREAITPEDINAYPLIVDQGDNALNNIMQTFSAGKGSSPVRYAPSMQLSSFADFMRRDMSLLIFTQPFLRAYGGRDVVIRPYLCPDARLNLCAVYRTGHPERGKLTRLAAWLADQYHKYNL